MFFLLFRNERSNSRTWSHSYLCVCVSHRFLDLAAEDMDTEDLGVVVAFGEGETVALWCPIMTPNTEQDLIDGIVRDLCPTLRV